MPTVGEIHWHEGLFLQPHHLQTLQRYFVERLATERRLAHSYPYGLIESAISADALENMMVRFDRLRAVMPSGTWVSAPDFADIPALDIKNAFESGKGSFVVRLGVPLWFAERANTVSGETDDWRVKRMFRVAELERTDENTGENPQPVMIRRINARLLLDSDDSSDMEVLPVLRIRHAAGDEVGLPRCDPQYIPPCMTLGGSPVLRDLVRDLASQVEASRKELVIQINRGGFKVESMRGLQFEQMLRLRTLNRFAGSLPHLAAAPSSSPSAAYVALRELLGELTALYPDRDLFDVPPYDHDNPAPPFLELDSRIRQLLRGAVEPSFVKVPFVPETAREGLIQVAALTDEHFAKAQDYFLGVQTKEDPKTVAVLVEDPDKFKLMARSLAFRAIFGVKLALERIPPLELPSQSGLVFFRMQRGESPRMWERIVEEKAMSVRWPGMDASDFKVALYMTIPSGRGGV